MNFAEKDRYCQTDYGVRWIQYPGRLLFREDCSNNLIFCIIFMTIFLSPRGDGYVGFSAQSNDWQIVEKLSALTPFSESLIITAGLDFHYEYNPTRIRRRIED